MLAVAVSLAIGGCGGGSGGSSGPRYVNTLSVPGIDSTVVYSFDLGTVDPATGRYYVTDRTNKSIDVVDANNLQFVGQFKAGFAGCNTGSPTAPTPLPTCAGANNDMSGPDGLDIVGPNLYVGDVNALWILDKATGAVVKKIAIPSSPTFLRADEGCFDADHNLYGISTPGANHPFMTFVDTVTQSIVATVVMDDSSGGASAGLEACTYDHVTGKFFVNNDGSTANPRGEIDGIPASAIVAVKPGPVTLNFASIAATSVYPLGNCDPTGLALGPGNDIGAMCRQGGVGEKLTFQILDRRNGSVLANLNIGGGDQIAYDAGTNRWFLADSRWTKAGTSCGAGSATCPLSPVVGMVDGTSRTIIGTMDNGNNSHSIAVSPNHIVLTPFTAPSAAGGGAAFPTGGISLFAAQ
ncbi:MAG: YncE family protein [Usitatibacter sp.]